MVQLRIKLGIFMSPSMYKIDINPNTRTLNVLISFNVQAKIIHKALIFKKLIMTSSTYKCYYDMA
jgi:hypothetical protein